MGFVSCPARDESVPHISYWMESASDERLTLKTVLLLALSSLRRNRNLQALSVSPLCLDFATGLVKVFLKV